MWLSAAIKTGVLEAVKEVRHMSLGRWARARYDEHMKMVRDQNARDDYVRDSGAEQERNSLTTLIVRMDAAGEGNRVTRLQDPEFIAGSYTTTQSQTPAYSRSRIPGTVRHRAKRQ